MLRKRWENLVRVSERLRLVHHKPFCTKNKPPTTTNNNDQDAATSVRNLDAYRQLDKLDFMTAAKILFTEPPKKKKFGIDFHLVQLFFACMPSLAVYLVAQYARYEMRKMEAELELKKKQAEEEAEKAKELELIVEEKEAGIVPELLDVKVRLEALESTVKEIVVESKKQLTKKPEDVGEKKLQPNNIQYGPETKETSTTDNLSKQNSISVGSDQDQKGKTQVESASEDVKK